MALKLKQLESCHPLCFVQLANRLLAEKLLHVFRGAVKDDTYIGISGCPRVLEQLSRFPFVQGHHGIP